MIRRQSRPAVASRAEKLYIASQWQLIRWKFFKHKLAVVALMVLAMFYLTVMFAEIISPYDPRKVHLDHIYVPPQKIRFLDHQDGLQRPFVYALNSSIDQVTLGITYEEDRSMKHPLRLFVRGDPYTLLGRLDGTIHLFGTSDGTLFLFGTDKLGRDLLSRIIFGGRISLTIGLVGVFLSLILGIVIGGISGYLGDTVDTLIQRGIEFIRSIPTLPLWMALSAALPPHWSTVQIYFGIVVILSLVQWTYLARAVRGKFIALREEDFVAAAVMHGASTYRVIFRHLLPSFYSYIIAILTLSLPRMILAETALSFIGLGMQPPAISWGVLLKESQSIRVMANSPWLLIPGVFVVISILAFNFLGDGMRDAADPYAAV